MSKYKKETTNIKIRSQGWTKSVYLRTKFYRKDNWVIAYCKNISIAYFIIDNSYAGGYYVTGKKQKFLEEKRKLAYKNTLVWKAMHGEYKKETEL